MGFHPLNYYNDDGTVNTGSTSRGVWHAGWQSPDIEPANHGGSEHLPVLRLDVKPIEEHRARKWHLQSPVIPDWQSPDIEDPSPRPVSEKKTPFNVGSSILSWAKQYLANRSSDDRSKSRS